MPTTTKKKISDFFNPITNPGGGFPSMSMNTAHSTPSFLPPKKASLKDIMAGISSMPAGPQSRVPEGPVAPVAPSPILGGGGSRGGAPVAPAPVVPSTTTPAPAATTETPKQWLNADGTMKTPEQIASEIGNQLKAGSGQGDIGTLAGNEFGGAEKTEEQLQAEAALVNNARNDIATGETDPYKNASQSGIAYTPAELSAIEKSYAGIYDPAIVTAHAKLEAKQKENEEKRKAEEAEKSDERAFKNDLQKLAVSHGYDLEKMSKSHEYDVILQSLKSKAEAGANGMTDYSDERSQRTVQSVDELLPQVDANPGIFGASAAAPIPDFLRTQPFLDFRTELDTLKASIAFNELTAMREASKTGGALGNVSNIELGLLESALGALNMSQSPENFKEQLNKVKSSVNRWRVAQGANPVGASSGGSSKPQTMVLNGQTLTLQPDGTYE